jgi:hypothetical protein
MDKTKKEIIKKMKDEMPYALHSMLYPYIEEAMQIYAEQEAKSYANWISNQVIAGRTSHKLWIDYQLEIGA